MVGLTTTLGKQGVMADDVDRMAENCLKVVHRWNRQSPVVFNLEDLKRIYRQAL
jgi:alcohol dehydrogenase class IV